MLWEMSIHKWGLICQNNFESKNKTLSIIQVVQRSLSITQKPSVYPPLTIDLLYVIIYKKATQIFQKGRKFDLFKLVVCRANRGNEVIFLQHRELSFVCGGVLWISMTLNFDSRLRNIRYIQICTESFFYGEVNAEKKLPIYFTLHQPIVYLLWFWLISVIYKNFKFFKAHCQSTTKDWLILIAYYWFFHFTDVLLPNI